MIAGNSAGSAERGIELRWARAEARCLEAAAAIAAAAACKAGVLRSAH
jgi:hypothetical protein